MVVPPRSPVVGKTMADLDFRSETCMTGLAIWRTDNPIRTDVGTTPLEEGDALLLYGPGDQTRSYDPRPDFLWMHGPHRQEAPRKLRHLGKWAALIMTGVIALAGFNLLPIAVAALGGAALMVLIGILPLGLLYEQVEWRTIVLAGAMFPLGLAMEKSVCQPAQNFRPTKNLSFLPAGCFHLPLSRSYMANGLQSDPFYMSAYDSFISAFLIDSD